MKSRILFFFRYFLFWLFLFVIAKVIFLLYQHSQSFHLPFKTWLLIIYHGLRLDLSTTGYLLLIPGLILALTSLFKPKIAIMMLNVYTAIVLPLILIITFVDFEAYKYWGTRLDSAPLRFLAKPKETLASSSFITIIIYLLLLFALTWFLYRVYRRRTAGVLDHSGKAGIKGFLLLLVLTAALFIPIRGGFGVSPVNTGTVYFSKTAFANHAAINVIWNFGQSLIERKESHNPYIFYKEEGYEGPLKQLYASGKQSPSVLKTNRPDIILIIMESFSAKLIEPLGGIKGVTPQFNELVKQGLLFSEIYSTDSRTDKGLATVISGYPVLEAIPILKYPEKTQHLPYLSKSLINKGYHAGFLYGGDVDFANIRSYLVNGRFSKIETDTDFPVSQRTGKWGVPDHLVFDRFLKDVKADTGQWFKVLLTLSNHEPFEIPMKPKFGDKDLTSRFYSSAYYADSCLGNFIREFRESGLWDNTLIIIVADHGTRLPQFDDIFEPRKHHIPLLFTGGAVAIDSVVEKTGSQADIAVTLLRQMDIPTDDFILGKDLLSDSSRSFAFYSIKNGIAMMTDSSAFGYDFITDDFSYTQGKIDTSHVKLAKSLQQFIFGNYLDLSKH